MTTPTPATASSPRPTSLLDAFGRGLTARETYHFHLLISGLLGPALGSSAGGTGSDYRHLTQLLSRLAPSGTVFRGPCPLMPPVAELQAEAIEVHSARVGRTGTIAYASGGDVARTAHTAPEVTGWVSELAGSAVVPFGAPYYYFLERPGDCLPAQVHELAVRSGGLAGEETAEVVLVSCLVAHGAGAPESGCLYRLDGAGRRHQLEERVGEWVVLRASGTPHGRPAVAPGDFVCSLSLLYTPVQRALS
jgi:hypothetical protein